MSEAQVRASDVVEILGKIQAEVIAQERKWGIQRHPIIGGEPAHETKLLLHYRTQRHEAQALSKSRYRVGQTGWDDVLLEEVYEALAETDSDNIETELVQVAAVAVSAILSERERVRKGNGR